MSPDIADVAKTSTPATALASPSSTIEKSNQVGIEITSSQTQEGALWNEAGLDTASPSLPIDESDMAPSQTSPEESTEHLASVEKTSDMASPFSTIGRLNTSSDETISSDTQEITHSTEALRYITPSYFELDKSDTAASKMASSQTLTVELVNSTEAVTDMDSKNSDADAPITGSDLIIITKDPKIQEQSISAESPPGNDCSRVVTDRQNMTSELAEATSVEILELPFGPFPVGDTQETAPPSPVAETSRTSSISQPMELNSPERNDRGTSEEDASSTTSHFSNICDAYNKSEITDKSPTESPKLTFSTDQELRQGPPNISLSPYSLSTTDRGGDVVESCLTELIDPNPSSQVTPEIDSPYLGVCKINAISEGVQASLIETTESASTAADTSDKASQSLTPDDSSVVPDPFETISAEGQEHIMLAEVSQEVDLHLPSADGLRRETEFAETSSTELSELCHSPKDTQDESSSASSPIASAMGSSSYERNATDIHEESISEDALDEQTHPFSIGGVHRESGFVESSSVEMADFDFSAASISDTAFPSTVAALPPVILEGLEGFEFSQPEVEDQTVSERTSGMNSPTYSVGGRDVTFRFDEEHTTNMIDFNLPAGATLEMGHSIADETSIPEGFDLSSIATQDHPDPEGALNDPSFSIGVLNEDFDNDDTTMTEMYDLFSSADTGVEMPGSLTCEMPTIMASESLEMSSPEIKLEPISMDGISHMDSLPSATLNQDIVSQLIGECAPETREVTLLSEATPDTAPTLEADASTVIDGDIEMSSFDMQLVPVSASEDTVSPCMIPANTSKSSRKRVHFDVDDHGDDQYPPAKKMQREFIAVWDVPRMKTIDLLSGDIETGLLNVQQLPSPIDSLPDMTSPLASPINANMTFDTTETSHCNTRGVSLSADLPLKLSIDVKHADPEITPTTTSTFIESPLTKIKK
jgi:hypothetical protein